MNTKLFAWTSAAALGAVMLLAGPAAIGQAPPEAGTALAPSRDPNAVPRIPGQNLDGMRIYIRSGLKTHGAGSHDYPQFLADFSKILTEKGAVVDGSFHAPLAEELAKTDVMIIFKGDAGYMTPTEKAALEGFVKRGGGLVLLHDSMCGPDPAYMAKLAGGAKKHGETNYTNGANVPYTIVAKDDPIMAGMSDFAIQDEAFYSMTWASNPGIKVLATAVMDPKSPAAIRTGHAGEVVPQIWSYEHSLPGGQPARAFVWMQGHTYTNMTDPRILPMVLRGIAWAAKKPVNELVDYKPPAQPARRNNAPAAG
jgi:type 1 glutamine amidotransferase